MKINFLKSFCIVAAAALVSLDSSAMPVPKGARNQAFTASANGKYVTLVQELTCPSDSAKYGNFNDYGYWEGGAWCGQTGAAGYWVWLKPTWYVWAAKAR